jgi:hypothetical protein
VKVETILRKSTLRVRSIISRIICILQSADVAQGGKSHGAPLTGSLIQQVVRRSLVTDNQVQTLLTLSDVGWGTEEGVDKRCDVIASSLEILCQRHAFGGVSSSSTVQYR